jgi:hypothetical protein
MTVPPVNVPPHAGAPAARPGPLRRVGRAIGQGFCLLFLGLVILFTLATLYVGGYLGWELGHKWHGTVGGIIGAPLGALAAFAVAMIAGAGAKNDD